MGAEGGPSENRASALGKWPGVHRKPAVPRGTPCSTRAPEPAAAVQSVIPAWFPVLSERQLQGESQEPWLPHGFPA